MNFSDNIVIVVDGDEAKTARDRRLQKVLNIAACYLERQTRQPARFLCNVSVERQHPRRVLDLREAYVVVAKRRHKTSPSPA